MKSTRNTLSFFFESTYLISQLIWFVWNEIPNIRLLHSSTIKMGNFAHKNSCLSSEQTQAFKDFCSPQWRREKFQNKIVKLIFFLCFRLRWSRLYLSEDLKIAFPTNFLLFFLLNFSYVRITEEISQRRLWVIICN